MHIYSLKLAKANPAAINNNSDRYNLINVTSRTTVANNLRPDEIFFEDEGLVIRRRASGAPMPQNGHLDPPHLATDANQTSGKPKAGGSAGPVEVPTVIPITRVRWA